MLGKKQPRAQARQLFPLNFEEDPAGTSNHQSNSAGSHLTNTTPQHTDLNPMCENLSDDNLTREKPANSNKFLAQSIIVTGCLIITLMITQNQSHPSTWARARIHTAINASDDSTFGYLFNSKLFQSIVKNGKNLIRLEEITKKIINPTRYSSANSLSSSGIQPVQGQISRGFGPQVNPLDGRQQYSTGVEWITIPGTEVLAINDGVVTAVIPASSAAIGGEGGMITVDQGSGLSAIYHSLTGIRVNRGAQVKKGNVLGKTLSSEFFLEVKRDGLFIDPLTLNLN